MKKLPWVLSFLFLIGACLPGSLAAAETSPAILSRYVLLAHSAIEARTVLLARAILAQPNRACPVIQWSDGDTTAMVRRRNPNPAAFGVEVCEAALLPRAGASATLGGQPLPLPVSWPLRVSQLAVVGDSGCKESKQTCGSEAGAGTWPFAAITRAAAADKPDLVVHVGDYNYRGTPNKTGAGEWSYDGCVPAGGEALVRQSTYDTWTTWNEDFFTPAAPLLAAAPWVVTRGNHELCSRAGQGWFFFLDPHSPVLNPYETQPGCDAPTSLTQPYLLRLENLDLVLFDTANACGGEDPESPAGTAYELRHYALQLNTIPALLGDSSRPAWLVGHRPIWSLYQSDPNSAPVSQNQTLQPALAATPAGELPAQISMLLSGHMHQFFSLTFQSGARPPQLVIGNSGVALSGNQLPSPFSLPVDGVAAKGLSLAEGSPYGYLSATVEDGGQWKGEVKAFDPSGKALAQPLATCGLPLSNGRLCQAGGISGSGAGKQ